ncbi:hypothetical protein Taro_010653 [Colocasia esculenta]|uniref:Uncharacterized protein n=1 Tax=Colocasia esculenta TaxID=4460 RepID=A0A843U7K6_COLES|nr:hypothetical protein [Colocasia esculenta]
MRGGAAAVGFWLSLLFVFVLDNGCALAVPLNLQKMAALKKAYADILLNMAKESAARIVASDLRALRFQQDLFRAKEDAVGTLVRVKGIMDSKVNEAVRLSLSQASRIQDLESQLIEAEKTIKYLKIELKRVNDEVSSMRSNQTERLDKQSTTEGHATSQGCMPQKALSQKTASDQCYFSFENESQVEPLEDFTKNNFVHDPVLTSIIMRSKEPELYRNGCTQRIRAFEQSILTRKVSHGQIDDQLSKNKCFTCEDGVTKEPNITELPEVDNVLTVSKGTDGSKDTGQHGGNCEGGRVPFQGFSLQRKRTRIKRMSSVPNTTKQVETGHEPSKSPSFNSLEASRMIDHDETILLVNGEVLQKMDANLDPVSAGSPSDSEGDQCHLGSCINSKRSSLLKCQNLMPVEADVNGTYSGSDDQKYPSVSTNVDDVNCRKPDISDVLSEGSVRNNGNSMLAPDDESGINLRKSENLLDTSISKAEPEKTGGHLMNPESVNGKNVQSSGAPADSTGDNRLLKYTFRRKRKRGSSACVDENVQPEKINTSDERPVGKQSILSEHLETTLLTGSSRDSRRIAQVARQLISLSEKRW